MKKLFYAFMFAAASLMVSCGTPSEEGKEPGGDTEKEFYGLMMDDADVTILGNDNFLLQMYSYTSDGTAMARLLSAQVTIPGVDLEVGLDNIVLPEGTYELTEGEVGDTGAYIKGSYYDNFVAATPYTALFTEGTMEVKHTSKGHRVTIWAKGVDAATGKAVEDIEFRFENDLVFNPNVIEVIATEDCPAYALFQGQYNAKANLWVIEAAVEESFTYFYDFYILTPLTNTFEDGIPSGTYPLAYTGEANTVIPTVTNENGQIISGGSLFFEETSQGLGLYDTLWGGEMEIVNNGDGTYEFAVTYYNYWNIPQVAVFSGELSHYDNRPVDYAEMYWYGNSRWYVALGSAENNICYALEMYTAENSSINDGLASGTYNVTDTAAPFTIVAGYIDGNYVEGSYFGEYSNNGGVYDLVSGGTAVVDNKGNDTYKIDINLQNAGYVDLTGYTSWTYEGEFDVYDATQSAAPAKAAIRSNKTISKVAKDAEFDSNIDRRNRRF